ncbi:serine protease [Pseudofrankia inefficax]|uniref:Uncharacterized protein n=1 Tax=Pseudofrankia inefficax (strain DSM 45817 / CECT 9037 / DDB 130130 / EuI1c) TaxID=298654 RepID=E3J6T8_PSEI1|nr:serine protease [Pseudofrankia inefficax]ADP82012.1 hypothetical protein FraEuI1c_4008 [Pseudofrankia inefficax]
MDVPEEMFEVAEAHSEEILALPDVTGWDVGLAEYGDELSTDYAIRIYVNDLSSVEDGQLPTDFDGYPTNILEGRLELDALPDLARYDPLIAGCEIENGDLDVGSSGTLGMVVRHTERDVLCGLTCAHVLCFAGYGIGDAVCQPARVAGGSPEPANVIGGLTDWNLDYDCAIFELRESITPELEILEIGPVAGSVLDIPEIDPYNLVKVSKRGRTTGLTWGHIIGYNRIVTWDSSGRRTPAYLLVRLDPACPKPTIGAGGDSGAVLVDDVGRVVGLYRGHLGDRYGMAIPWKHIAGCLPIDVP